MSYHKRLECFGHLSEAGLQTGPVGPHVRESCFVDNLSKSGKK